MIIDIDGKNEQSLLYDEKDIEEDIELLDLFHIKDYSDNGSSEHIWAFLN